MTKTTRHDTSEHLLATGEQLCLQRGFTGMGLSELLSVAGVPKGSFYHYFRSKEAFGVAMLERYFTHFHRDLCAYFAAEVKIPRQRLLDYYARSEQTFREDGRIDGCLVVKLSAEVCDLSEEMRMALEKGSTTIIRVLSAVLQRAVDDGTVILNRPSSAAAEILYMLWMGACLQSKICRNSGPLRTALSEISRMLSPATF